jgi:Kef-type K+ transport system membrane component KefB
MVDLHIILALMAIFIGALLGGRLAALLHVPRVTGYLLTGLLLGPSAAKIFGYPAPISTLALDDLQPLTNLALALIMMNVGGQFRMESLRRLRWRIFVLSGFESSLTFILVALGCAATNQWWLHTSITPFSLAQTSLLMGLFFGVIAIATAPAATMMVIREYEAEGPTTSTLLSLVGLNNLLSVIAFLCAMHWVFSPEEGNLVLLWHLTGPLLIGGGIGLIIATWSQRLELASEFKCIILGALFSISILSEITEINALLCHLIFGIVLASSSPRWHQLYAAIKQIDYPLYVAFFVLAGASLHIETLLHIGSLGVAYVILRIAGKWWGARWGAKLASFNQREQQTIGMTLMAQAGVAIGLASTLAEQWDQGGHLVEAVILGSVVVFELVGPLSVRHGLVLSGEVPILSLLRKRAPQGAIEGLHNVVDHFRSSLGLPAGHNVKDPGDILVRHIMRQNVETIVNDTPFNKLLRFISHSRYDRFPVVDGAGRFVGIIDYTEIRNLLFEPELAKLIVASDLLVPNHCALGPDQSLREVLVMMRRHRHISYFPVLDPEQPDQLLGVLRQNDVLAAFRSFNTDID